jgi:hypothetical protein
MCVAIAHPYPIHTSKQRRSHSHHASLHRHLCPARTQPAATLCAALPPLSSVSCRLEPPSRLCSVKNLRQMKLHPRVEPLRHKEGLKPTDTIHFPCHGRPIVDSSLQPPSGSDSTSTSFTPAHSSSLARQTPPSTAPAVNRSRASPAAHPPPWSVFISDFPPLHRPKSKPAPLACTSAASPIPTCRRSPGIGWRRHPAPWVEPLLPIPLFSVGAASPAQIGPASGGPTRTVFVIFFLWI